MFDICGNVCSGDFILVRMASGRIGRYRLYSVLSRFDGTGIHRTLAVAVGYYAPVVKTPPRPIKGLLGDGSRWVRSDRGELAHLPRGFTKPTSEFWAILERGKTNSTGTSRIDAEGNMHVGQNL